jgi:hypothetical protein
VSSSEGGALFSELVRYPRDDSRRRQRVHLEAVDNGETMRMLAIHLNGETREHFDYSIAGTACQTVMSKGFGVYQSGLAKLLGANRDSSACGPRATRDPLNDSAGRPSASSRSSRAGPSRIRRFSSRSSGSSQCALRPSAQARPGEHRAARFGTSYREIFGASETRSRP